MIGGRVIPVWESDLHSTAGSISLSWCAVPKAEHWVGPWMSSLWYVEFHCFQQPLFFEEVHAIGWQAGPGSNRVNPFSDVSIGEFDSSVLESNSIQKHQRDNDVNLHVTAVVMSSSLHFKMQVQPLRQARPDSWKSSAFERHKQTFESCCLPVGSRLLQKKPSISKWTEMLRAQYTRWCWVWWNLLGTATRWKV